MLCRYTLIGHNDYIQPAGSPAGVYTFNVPEDDQIQAQQGDIIGVTSGGDDRLRIPEYSYGVCQLIYLIFFYSGRRAGWPSG